MGHAESDKNRRLAPLIGVAVIVTAIVFFPCLFNQFVAWDDVAYVVENETIRTISIPALKTIFTKAFVSTYCPLPMLSFALEYHLFKLNPFAYHLTNYLLHISIACLVFCFIYLIARNSGTAFLSALLFGIHPLHVESVAWIAERKDLLSTLFFMLVLIGYRLYLDSKRPLYYYLCLVLMIFSLLSKGMAVTVPLVLLLVDYYNGRRFGKKIILEKIPFFAAAGIFAYITWHFQAQSGATGLKADMVFKIYNVTKTIPFYLSKFFFPLKLSVIYPYYNIGLREISEIKYNIALLAILAGAAFISLKRTRKMIFGVSFFLVTILPVLKIIPIGDEFAADRYMYLPSIGIIYILCESISYLFSRYGSLRILKAALLTSLSAWLIFLSVRTWDQCKVWKDSETLFLNALKQYPANPLINLVLGDIYMQKGNSARAVRCYEKAAFQKMRFKMREKARKDLDALYKKLGTDNVSEGKDVDRREAAIFTKMAYAEMRSGNFDDAIELFKKTAALDPDTAAAYNNLGYAYYKKGDTARAKACYEKALEIDPSSERAKTNLGYIKTQPKNPDY